MECFEVTTEAIHGVELDVTLCVDIVTWGAEPGNGIMSPGWDYDTEAECYLDLGNGFTQKLGDKMVDLIHEDCRAQLDGLVNDRLSEQAQRDYEDYYDGLGDYKYHYRKENG